MNTTRMEAFSDGVIAIIITIMVLEMKIPDGSDISALMSLASIFLSYVISFIYVGIYWNNHHHLLQAVPKVNGRVLWANLHLLFWLSVVPFVTGWMGKNHFTQIPVAVYGFVLLMAGIAYYILSKELIELNGNDSKLAAAVGKDWKGIVSIIVYACAIPLTLVNPWISFALYILVAVLWFVPDTRIENLFKD